MSQLSQFFIATILSVIYVAGIVYFRRRRAWLGYYLFAAIGLTLILVFGAQASGLANKIEYLVTWCTANISTWFGINALFLGQNELMIADKAGWVVLRTTIECSALIETSVLLSLILFYPAFTIRKKIGLLAIGIPVTWISNLMRLLIITGMTAFFGRQAIFFGHAIVGRFFFLVVTIGLYWFLLTMPTVREVGRGLKDA